MTATDLAVQAALGSLIEFCVKQYRATEDDGEQAAYVAVLAEIADMLDALKGD